MEYEKQSGFLCVRLLLLLLNVYYLYNILLLAGLYRGPALSCSCFKGFLTKVVSRAGNSMTRQMTCFVVGSFFDLRIDDSVRSCREKVEKTSSDMLGFEKSDR